MFTGTGSFNGVSGARLSPRTVFFFPEFCFYCVFRVSVSHCARSVRLVPFFFLPHCRVNEDWNQYSDVWSDFRHCFDWFLFDKSESPFADFFALPRAFFGSATEMPRPFVVLLFCVRGELTSRVGPRLGTHRATAARFFANATAALSSRRCCWVTGTFCRVLKIPARLIHRGVSDFTEFFFYPVSQRYPLMHNFRSHLFLSYVPPFFYSLKLNSSFIRFQSLPLETVFVVSLRFCVKFSFSNRHGPSWRKSLKKTTVLRLILISRQKFSGKIRENSKFHFFPPGLITLPSYAQLF